MPIIWSNFMKIHYDKNIIKTLFFLAIFFLTYFDNILAQPSIQLKSILRKFESYRYSNVFIYKMNSVNQLIPILGGEKDSLPPSAATLKEDVKLAIESAVLKGGFLGKDTDKDILKEMGIRKWTAAHDAYTRYQDNLKVYNSNLFASAYIITNRYSGRDDLNIIALITSKSKDKTVETALEFGSNKDGVKDIYLANDLQNKFIDTLSLYNYLLNRIYQDDVLNVTAEAQGIDGETKFLPQKYGTSYSINEDDIQQYLRITEGQPQEYDSPNELTIGLFDVIRYRRYDMLEEVQSQTDENFSNSIDNTDKTQSIATDTNSTEQVQNFDTPKKIYNKVLPLYGIELKYGLPEINYPSLWSERMTLSVMWQSNKFGIILPTNGWSSLATDVFSAERKLTNAGLGIYGSLDFPIKLLNQGGVFNFNGSYVFGDAAVNPVATQFMFAGRNASGQSDSASYRSLDLSYLPRFHAQAHYSFAVDIDRTAFFRFKLGATMYVIQRFAELDQQNGNDENGRPVYEKKNRQIDQYSYDDLSTLNRFDQLKIAAMNGLQGSEVIAGLSGRIEFMNRSRTVPWGASMQFFDGCISGDIWAQVKVLNGFDVKLQAQYFQAALRDPKPWEEQTIVLPSLQMIFNF